MIGWLLLLQTVPPPALKTCPDGATVRAEQQCLTYPDHRLLLDHQPAESEQRLRWRCAGGGWSEVRLRSGQTAAVEQRRLVTLTVNGRRAAPALYRRVAADLAGLATVHPLQGRCLQQRAQPPLPIIIVETIDPTVPGRRIAHRIALR